MLDTTNSDFIERIALLEDRCVPLQPFLKNVPIGDRTTLPDGSYRDRDGNLLLQVPTCRVHTSGKIGHDEHLLNDEDLSTIKRWIPDFKVDPRREAPANSFLEQLPKIFEILLTVFGLKPDVVEHIKMPDIIMLLDSREPTRTHTAIGSGDKTLAQPAGAGGGHAASVGENEREGREATILRAMKDLNAVGGTNRKKRRMIVAHAFGEQEDPDNYKHLFSEMVRAKKINSRGGPNGGYWLDLQSV